MRAWDRLAAEGYLQPLRSHLSLAFASATVCHCMSEGSSLPPQASSLMRSCNCPHPFPVVDFPCLQGFACHMAEVTVKKLLAALWLSLALAATPSLGFAWGREGHRVVA